MKIDIIGGGPAGLFFAILMKRLDPAHRIRVFEKNPRLSTFGWGVVFSDRTLGYLRESDEPVHDAMAARFETWDNVDVVHRGEKVSIHGNRFSGIARIALLDILQRRALDLGVDVRFETQVTDPASLEPADLLVGADGVASVVRAARKDAFGPSFEPRANRYIWLGTERIFDGLTLTFRVTELGVFIAHSYKFQKDLSTFIVEVDPLTFERASLAGRSDEDARALLAGVFRDDLEGRPLLSNGARWVQFAVVRNRCWHSGRTVLLGDALHTVHFSIGSGTKLALEDAIALSRAFAEHRAVEDALPAFERARKPVVDAYQEAAGESLVWFERVAELVHLDPLPFAWSAMTRSGRVDDERLRRRDPAFVAAVERWRAERGEGRL